MISSKDSAVRVLVLSGAGDAFCSGYDLQIFAETPGPVPGSQKMPWDPLVDFQFMWSITNSFMSLWRSLKPVICKVITSSALLCSQSTAGTRGWGCCRRQRHRSMLRHRVDGGHCSYRLSSCTRLVASPSFCDTGSAFFRGCPTTAMWVHRLGAERAKRMLLTGMPY